MNHIYWLLAGIVLFCVNMGEGGRNMSTVIEPVFIPLESRQGSYAATIRDEGKEIQVRDLSFYGSTSVGGIRQESTDSFSKLELGKLKAIRVVTPSFQSKRYSDQEFSLITVTTSQGTEIKDLLVPKNIIICAIERSTGVSRAWWLRKIEQINIEGEQQFDAKDFEKKVFGKESKSSSPVQGKTAAFSAEQFAEFEKGVKTVEKSSVIKSFVGIIDAFIGFVKVLFKKFLQIVGF